MMPPELFADRTEARADIFSSPSGSGAEPSSLFCLPGHAVQGLRLRQFSPVTLDFDGRCWRSLPPSVHGPTLCLGQSAALMGEGAGCDSIDAAALPKLTLSAATELLTGRYVDRHPARMQRRAIGAAMPHVSRKLMSVLTGAIATHLEPVGEALRQSVFSAPRIYAHSVPLQIKGASPARMWAWVAEWPATEGSPQRLAVWLRATPDRIGRYAQQEASASTGELILPLDPAFFSLFEQENVVVLPDLRGISLVLNGLGLGRVAGVVSGFERLCEVLLATDEVSPLSATIWSGGALQHSRPVPDPVIVAQRRRAAIAPLLPELISAIHAPVLPSWAAAEAPILMRRLRLLLAGIDRAIEDGSLRVRNPAIDILARVCGPASAWVNGRLPETQRQSAMVSSLVESARLNGRDPRAYLAEVIRARAGRSPAEDAAALLPWRS